jgi:hypothetical protein
MAHGCRSQQRAVHVSRAQYPRRHLRPGIWRSAGGGIVFWWGICVFGWPGVRSVSYRWRGRGVRGFQNTPPSIDFNTVPKPTGFAGGRKHPLSRRSPIAHVASSLFETSIRHRQRTTDRLLTSHPTIGTGERIIRGPPRMDRDTYVLHRSYRQSSRRVLAPSRVRRAGMASC